MKHLKIASMAQGAMVKPGRVVPQTKAPIHNFSLPFLILLLGLALNSCGLEENYYDKAEGDGAGGRCKIIQDMIICPCNGVPDTTLIG